MFNKIKTIQIFLFILISLFIFNAAAISSQDIFTAVQNEDIETVTGLLEENPELANKKNEQGYTPLMEAVKKENIELVEILIDNNANINEGDGVGRTALHYAALSGNTEIGELLLENGASANGIGGPHVPLSFSTTKEMAELLIEKGAHINIKNNFDVTPLHEAAFFNYKELAEVLIEKEAIIDAKDKQGETPLHYSATSGSPGVAELLIEGGAEIDIKNKQGQTPLHLTLDTFIADQEMGEQKKVAEILLTSGASIDAKDINDVTPLQRAIFEGRKDFVKLFINGGADINAKDTAGHSPLQLAGYKGDREIITFLIENGADTDEFPLHYAAFTGNIEKTKEFSENPFNIYKKDRIGFTPLHWAVLGESKEAVNLLIEKGAMINVKSRGGLTPLSMAFNHNSFEIVDLLISLGASKIELEEMKLDICKKHLKTIADAVDLYKKTEGNYPDSLDNVIKAGYLKENLLCPSCQKPYIYLYSVKPDNYTIKCGGENAHIKTGETEEGHYPVYNLPDGLILKN